jgi:hypothetical protein
LRPKIREFVFAVSGRWARPFWSRPPFQNFWIRHCSGIRARDAKITRPLCLRSNHCAMLAYLSTFVYIIYRNANCLDIPHCTCILHCFQITFNFRFHFNCYEETNHSYLCNLHLLNGVLRKCNQIVCNLRFRRYCREAISLKR